PLSLFIMSGRLRHSPTTSFTCFESAHIMSLFSPVEMAPRDPILGLNEAFNADRSEEHTSELQSRENLVCRLLLEKKNTTRPLRAACLLHCPRSAPHRALLSFPTRRSSDLPPLSVYNVRPPAAQPDNFIHLFRVCPYHDSVLPR